MRRLWWLKPPTSPRQDTTVKIGICARAGVPEYGPVSIPNREAIVHRDLRHGTYRQVATLSERDTVSVASAPEKSIPVALIFGGEQ